MIVYAFLYNPMIHESAASVISLHKTRKGAEMAMEFHKAEKLKEFNEDILWRKEHGDKLDCGTFGDMEAWFVSEMRIEE